MKFDFVIIAVLVSIANGQPSCEDSELRFNIDGAKQKCTWDELACTGSFYSDKYSSHCKATCNVIECCSDSLAKFKTPSDGYKDCLWVGKRSERCNDTELSHTCPVSCKLCTQPTIYELMSEIDLLKIDNDANVNELMSEIDLLEIENNGLRLRVDNIEVSQSQFCVYLDNGNRLCLPTVYRNGVQMVYARNSLKETWNYHKEAAITCGGYLADVMNEMEFEKLVSLNPGGWLGWIGGYQDKLSCSGGVGDCWKWTDGSLISYLGWESGQPNDFSTSDCMAVNYGGLHDDGCINKAAGVYVLPTDFTSNPDCDIVL